MINKILIISGDGWLPQIERFAGKYIYAKMSVRAFETALATMAERSEAPTGNTWVLVCNTKFWQSAQRVLAGWIRDFKSNGAFAYSQASNGNVALGATYDSYEWAGNKITFKIERALDIEFPGREFAMMTDISADGKTGHAGMGMFTFKGGQYIQNWLEGVNFTCAAA